jgi:hypothetical protein
LTATLELEAIRCGFLLLLKHPLTMTSVVVDAGAGEQIVAFLFPSIPFCVSKVLYDFFAF